MQHLKEKMKFLAIKHSALKEELKISKKILESASYEVDRMFEKKYFPEIQVAQEECDDELGENRTQMEIDENEDPIDCQPESHQGPNPTEEAEDTRILEQEEKKLDPEVKKLFRKIAIKIHPDKLVGLEEGFEKSRKMDLYLLARAAFEDNDILTLVKVCLDLGVEIPEITPQKLKETENKISSIKKELNHIESTIVWQWFFCSDDKQKDKILERLFEIMYERSEK